MTKFENRVVQNRRSPKNEDKMIAAYKEMNPHANRHDNKDVSAVRTKSGQTGYALLNESYNRSHDRDFHRGEDFIPTSALKKHMKGK